MFTIKGSVTNLVDLPETGNELGDVYYVTAEETTYVWMTDGVTPQWEELGTNIDTSDCVKKAELLSSTGSATDNTMTQLAITNALNNKANSSDIPTQLTDLTGVLPVPQGGTGKTAFNSGSFIIGNGTDGFTSLAKVPISKGGTNGTTVTEARTNLAVYTKENIYHNASGTSGTITLSQSANNYKWIEIVYAWSNIFQYLNLIPNTSGSKTANLFLNYTTDSGSQYISRSALIYVNNKTITWSRNRSWLVNVGGSNYTNNDKILIFSVYGFKS